MCKLGVVSQERLNIEVKLLLSDNRKSYTPRESAQQRMTLSDLEWPFHASRAISAVAEFLVSCLLCGRPSKRRHCASRFICRSGGPQSVPLKGGIVHHASSVGPAVLSPSLHLFLSVLCLNVTQAEKPHKRPKLTDRSPAAPRVCLTCLQLCSGQYIVHPHYTYGN